MKTTINPFAVQALGKSQAFFHAMKYSNKKKFEKFVKYGNGDVIAGYQKIWREVDTLMEDATLILYYARETMPYRMKSILGTSDKNRQAVIKNWLLKGSTPSDPFKAKEVLEHIVRDEVLTKAKEWSKDF